MVAFWTCNGPAKSILVFANGSVSLILYLGRSAVLSVHCGVFLPISYKRCICLINVYTLNPLPTFWDPKTRSYTSDNVALTLQWCTLLWQWTIINSVNLPSFGNKIGYFTSASRSDCVNLPLQGVSKKRYGNSTGCSAS